MMRSNFRALMQKGIQNPVKHLGRSSSREAFSQNFILDFSMGSEYASVMSDESQLIFHSLLNKYILEWRHLSNIF